MTKGIFGRPLIIDLNVILNGLGVAYQGESFKVLAHFEDRIYIPIKYFGELKGEKYHIRSYSYSVQSLPTGVQRKYNKNPAKTARLGLISVGIPIK